VVAVVIDFQLDADKEIKNITGVIRRLLGVKLKRRGIVVAVSGGIDSSVTAALCAEAVGNERVLGLLLPEKDSSDDTLSFSRLAAEHLGIACEYEDMTPILRAFGCYERQEEAVRKVLPEYGPGYKMKIVLPSILDSNLFNLYSLVAQSPEGEEKTVKLTRESFLAIVAATNFKQRTRKTLEYYYADKLHYAVAGTPNRLEYDQGFFVKLGDGAADIKPIAHLYKTQVFQLAEALGIPEEIRTRPPTTDTYSMPQSQEEFYFSLPYDKMDICLYGKNHNLPAAEVAADAGITPEQVKRIWEDIDQKRKTTRYLHLSPLLAGPVPEIGGNC
jgi:NAD+ synthase